MRSSLLFLTLIAGCGIVPDLRNTVLTDPAEQAIYQDRRAAVELVVKSNFDAVIADIGTGGGPALTEAFDVAGIPIEDRATRAYQLNTDLGLYVGNPGALITAIMIYGST